MKKQIFFKILGKKTCQCAPGLLAVRIHCVLNVPQMCPKKKNITFLLFVLNNFVCL